MMTARGRKHVTGVRDLITGVLLAGQLACPAGPTPARRTDARPAAPAQVSAATGPGDAVPLIREYVERGAIPSLGAFTPAEALDVRELYAGREDAPVWLEHGQPGANARDGLWIVDHVAADGLDPADFPGDDLHRLAAVLESQPEPPAGDVAAFDTGMSWAILRDFRQVHLGRVDASALGFHLVEPAETHDFPALLDQALRTNRLRETAASLAPPLAQYDSLRRALATYRSLAAKPSSLAPPPTPARSVHPGDPYAGLDAVHDRLVAVGDLPATAPRPAAAAVYAGPLVDAVRRFQQRHGLAADGVMGRQTIAALQVPLAARVRQIELALERLRWLPDLTPAPLIVMNIPMFHLWGWDGTPVRGAPSVQMDVIVGRSVDTETPVLMATMRDVVVRPFWNVPASIVQKEILPSLARDPAYLTKNDMELVEGERDDSPVVAPTPDNLVRLRDGELRLRQRPGPKNSLGLVKFDFPNPQDVYMHATPAQQLFSKARRDFSHGCVRVADPVGLAEWVLRGQPDWTRDRILAAMQGTATVRVPIPRPIQVLLFYNTAAVMPDDGTVHFAADIYGQDVRLERALARAQAVR
jgi:L,D-transpeptidase YcbB